MSDTNARAKKYGDILDILTIVALALTGIISLVKAIFGLAYPLFFCFMPGLIPLGYLIWLMFYAWFRSE